MDIATLYQLYCQHFLVDTDTRNIRKNTLFFALKGANFNGNAFAEKALQLGANYAIVDEAKYQTNPKIILVADVLTTLQKLANYHRKQLEIPVIALTGSNGKTTTKELIHGVLSKKYKTLATKGNLNNHIGVPLTILAINPTHEIAIVEMGANHQKEIEFLCSICEPDFGYITNFGKAHLEGFGGVAGVIKGKSELYTFLRENQKTAFVNPNDPIQVEKTKDIKKSFLDLDTIDFLGVDPFVKIRYCQKEIQTQLIGDYNVANIAVAITIGNYFGVTSKDIQKAIETYTPTNNRSQIIKKKYNTIFLDAYNANPTSMKAALENFAKIPHPNKVLILGDMFELGDESLAEHQAIVDLAATLHFEKQFFVGKHFAHTQTQQVIFETFEAVANHIKAHPFKESSILIKGSRGMGLERLLAYIE